MKKDWHNLSWLPGAPDDFTQRCNALRNQDAAELRALAGYRLNESQLHKLAKRCSAFSAPKGFETFRLAIIGNANNDFLKTGLKASALRYGLWLDVEVGGMGETVTSVLNPDSGMNRFKPDGVLLALNAHIWSQTLLTGKEKDAKAAIENLKNDIEMMAQALKNNSSAMLILQTMPQTPISLFGSLDRRIPGTLRRMIDDFNAMIWSTGLPVIDIAALAEWTGLSAWHNAGQWHWAKLPFSQNLIPLYTDYVTRFIGALRGRSRKCLVLDLDNTLWGGIIGDDGVEGIILGQGSPRGEAHLAIQRMALALRERGVVLAVCSKNDDSNARLPFSQHPEHLLKESHIAVFQANWSDKASNLEAIARALDLTPDALVFLDDNPAEREIVRRELPAVAVPEIPDDEPALWPEILSAAGYFEAVTFTESDLGRAEQYAMNAQRETLKVQSRDIGDYLQALRMEMDITSFTPAVRARVSQLINRSNQYNLTTRRYTEGQIEAVESDPACFCFSARLRDRFGDNGIISVVICREAKDTWDIDSWLMSCRVLGRRVETALLNHIALEARQAGKDALTGRYIPTAKNGMVEKHYEKLGFTHTGTDTAGETHWQLDLKNFMPAPVPITLTAGPEKKANQKFG